MIYGGGVAILIKNNIQHQLLAPQNTLLVENIGVRVKSGNDFIDILSCYYPGGSVSRDPTRKQTFIADLRKLTSSNNNYILGGDFNCRHGYWGCLRSNCWGNILHDKLQLNETQIKFPPDYTYIPADHSKQPSTLDFFLTNVSQNMSAVKVINDLSSDHLPIMSDINIRYDTVDNLCYAFNKANWPRFAKFINRSLPTPNDFDTITNINQIDNMINVFSDAVKMGINESVPKRSVAPMTKPLPNNIKIMIQLRNVFRRNWKRYRDDSDHRAMRRLNKNITKEINIFRNKSWNDMLSTLDKSSSPFWNVSKILRKKSGNIPTLKQNNVLAYTQQEKAEMLAQSFYLNHSISASLSDADTIAEVDNVANHVRFTNTNPHNNYLINCDKVAVIIRNLKNKKTPGLDGVNNKCLKNLPKKGIKYLTNIFNACLKLNYFPCAWKIAKTIPILKPSKPSDSPLSYRPISLLSSISKILEKIIKEKLNNFIIANSILPSQQFGFRNEHNTSQPLLKIRNLVKNNFTIGKSTGMVLLDIKAAFDSVWHNGLIFKMKQFNFPIELIKIIQNFLQNRSFNVYLGKIYSQQINISSGCPQGSCLSPVLYNVFTADIPTFSNCVTSIFADDTSILSSDIYSADIITNLQLALTGLNKYFNKWKILINPEKTQAIYFTRRRRNCYTPQTSLRFISHDIPWGNKVKYLGVMLDTKLNFNNHIPYIIDKINKITRMMYPIINRKSELNIENKKIIIKSIFHPIIFYCAPVWSTSAKCHLCKIQVAQNKLLKMIFKLPWHYSTRRLHILAGFELVHDKIERLTLNFSRRCLSSQYQHINELISS